MRRILSYFGLSSPSRFEENDENFEVYTTNNLKQTQELFEEAKEEEALE